MPSLFARHAPVATSIRFAQAHEFDAATWTEEQVPLVLVDMTVAEADEWEWITDTLTPGGLGIRGTKVYLGTTGDLLGIMLTTGTGWHVEYYDTVMVGDYVAVPFPGPLGTARTEQMATQQRPPVRAAAGACRSRGPPPGTPGHRGSRSR
ncbi:hypothetical protein [Streptomyces luteireticuli]|uniref:hypothetical protein n=1 Tax=Streptomyces luteireticuli TaxID=173858 RepID=UPI0035580EC4